ncbi:MAG: hypothetical protein HQK66_02110 [Desulfamplus sp.]|nr:hypothetical protein [Desulfamplus sp.]
MKNRSYPVSNQGVSDIIESDSIASNGDASGRLTKGYSRSQLSVLKRLYQLHEKFLGRENSHVHCKRGCSICCTCNVTITTIEGQFLVNSIPEGNRAAIKRQLHENISPRRYDPRITTNGLAALCMGENDLPGEENEPSWGKCPILTEENLCPFYEARPLGCRTLISREPCDKNGYAVISPLTLTINNLFMQCIEHLDARGYSGNFTDIVILSLEHGPDADPGTLPGGRNGAREIHLIENQPIPALMIPPEHREAVTPILEDIAVIFG